MATSLPASRPSIPLSAPSAPTTIDPAMHPALFAARLEAQARRLAYAGELAPGVAHDLVRDGVVRLVDVRTAEERKFVGYVPDSVHVPWMTGTALIRNPRFLRELESRVSRNEVIAFLCRSGTRSVAAATAATQAGFTLAFTVNEGFEGDLDGQGHRGTNGGWRFRGLPWIQD